MSHASQSEPPNAGALDDDPPSVPPTVFGLAEWGEEPPQLPPQLLTRVPGPDSRSWSLRMQRVAAPMGPKRDPAAPPGSIVFQRAQGSNVWDVDGNRYVDLAAGFGSLLLGHNPVAVQRALQMQAGRLTQAMGDVYPADAKIGLLEQLVQLFPAAGAQAILGLSGADAVSAALKTALLATGRPEVIAFGGAYHGLSYGPLAVCGLRESYRAPFSEQLNPGVHWAPFPSSEGELPAALQAVERALASGRVGALIFEPILGRGGVLPLLPAAAQALRALTERYGALLIADEIWTGLGRSGCWLYTQELGVVPDLICLGKGLGGGLPISVCLGTREVMAHWSREAEVVHTSTFSGAPLGCATALATLDVLRRHGVVERARRVGADFTRQLAEELQPLGLQVRGRGLMIGVELGGQPGAAVRVATALLGRGYLTSTGGTERETLVLTPALNVAEELLSGFVRELKAVIEQEAA